MAGTLAFESATRRIVDLALVTVDGAYTNGTDFRIATASALTTR